MKKVFVIILLLIIPLSIKASSIKSTEIEALDEVNINEKFDVKVKISFDGLNKKEGMGISLVAYELLFNNENMELASIKDDSEWNTKVYLNDNKYYLVSTLGKEIKQDNICVDNILYCHDYELIASFYGKNAKEEEIKIGDITVGMLPITTQEIQEDDVMLLNLTGKSSKLIKLKDSKNSKIDEKINLGHSISVTKEMVISSRNEKVNSKYTVLEKDNYLDEIEIEDYDLKFRKYINEYNLKIKYDVDKLNIKVKLSNKKAKYEIIGNESLTNDSEIKINVTALNGEVNTYSIKITKEEKEEIKKEKEDKLFLGIDFQNFKLDDKTMKTGGIILGSLLGLFLLIKIIVKLRDRKLEKAIKKL